MFGIGLFAFLRNNTCSPSDLLPLEFVHLAYHHCPGKKTITGHKFSIKVFLNSPLPQIIPETPAKGSNTQNKTIKLIVELNTNLLLKVGEKFYLVNFR